MKEAGNGKKSDDFKRFTELAEKLVAVPKTEVEKQKSKYERKKEKRPANR